MSHAGRSNKTNTGFPLLFQQWVGKCYTNNLPTGQVLQTAFLTLAWVSLLERQNGPGSGSKAVSYPHTTPARGGRELSSTELIHGSIPTSPAWGPENAPEILLSFSFLFFKTLVTKERLCLLKLDTNHPLIVTENTYWNIILKKTMKMPQRKRKETEWVDNGKRAGM